MVEFNGTISTDKFDKQVIQSTIESIVGINVDLAHINVVQDDNGHVVCVVVGVDNKSTADAIANTLKSQIGNDNCQAGVLCRAVRVFVRRKTDNSSPSFASSHQVFSAYLLILCCTIQQKLKTYLTN